MPLDTGRLLRIKGAVEGTLASANRSEGGRSPFSGKGLADGYNRYRGELLGDLTGTGLEDEFARMCPPFTENPPPGTHDLFGHDGFTSRAAAALEPLAGWIGGLVQEAEMRMNAEAYAQAKLKEERGIGFKP